MKPQYFMRSFRFKKLKHNGIFLMIVAALFFSLMGALVKHAATLGIPFMEAVFFRAFVSLAIIGPYMMAKKIPLFGNNFFLLFIRSASGFTALALSFYVTTRIPLADAAILNQTAILFVALFSALFLKEKISPALIIYILCAFVGTILIVKPQGKAMSIPGLLGLCSGLFASIAYISIRALHETDSFFTMVFNFSLLSSLGAFILGINNFVMPSLSACVALIALGLCGTIAQLTMTYSYKNTEATLVSPYAFTGVVFSALWGSLFWGELQDFWSILGTILIIACGIGILKIKRAKKALIVEQEI